MVRSSVAARSAGSGVAANAAQSRIAAIKSTSERERSGVPVETPARVYDASLLHPIRASFRRRRRRRYSVAPLKSAVHPVSAIHPVEDGRLPPDTGHRQRQWPPRETSYPFGPLPRRGSMLQARSWNRHASMPARIHHRIPGRGRLLPLAHAANGAGRRCPHVQIVLCGVPPQAMRHVATVALEPASAAVKVARMKRLHGARASIDRLC
jgi:hypothetical protein